MKKNFLSICLLVLPLGFLAAQTATAASGKFTLVSFEIGYAPCFSFAEEDALPASGQGSDGLFQLSNFGLNVRLSNPLIAGFSFYADGVGGSIGLLHFKYEVVSLARVMLGIGKVSGGINGRGTGITLGPKQVAGLSADEAAIVGLGVEIIPFSRTIAGAATEFDIAIQYLAQTSDLAKGTLFVGLNVGIGF